MQALARRSFTRPLRPGRAASSGAFLPGAFVEHRKSQIIPLEIRWIFRIE
jgi:hypothetical protein